MSLSNSSSESLVASQKLRKRFASMKRMALRSGRISSLPAPFLFGDLKIQLNRRSLMAPSQNLSIAALTPAAIPGLARK